MPPATRARPSSARGRSGRGICACRWCPARWRSTARPSRANDISFHLLNPETNNRIRMIPTDPDTGPVERADLVKGYEISKNNYVVLTQRRAARRSSWRPPTPSRSSALSTKKDIDRLLLERSLLPGARTRRPGVEAYTVIRDALERDGPHRAGPRGDAHPRAPGGAGAARQGHRRLHLAHGRRSGRSQGRLRRHPGRPSPTSR